MDVRINAGYIITDSVHIGNAEFVLGIHPNPNVPAPYVTWECKNNDNYFFGHYFGSELAAKKDLSERISEAVRIREQYLENRENAKGKNSKNKECER